MRIEEGKETAGSGVISGQRKKMTGSDRWGPHVSGSGRREAYRFGMSLSGPRAISLGWAEGLPGAFFIFLFLFFFFFFCFLISFRDFAYCIQTRSNQFLNFCKIHRNVLNQQETGFQNQNKIFTKVL
jgi:hypothetical protein